MIRSPVSSPAAPAGGWNVARAIAVSSHRNRSASSRTPGAPGAKAAGVAGWSRAKPGRSAAQSATWGLYFMVQEPRGYAPRSTPKLRWASRVKWATRSRSLTSGRAGRPSAASGRSMGCAGTSSGGSDQARRPGEDRAASVGSVPPPTRGAAEAQPPGSGTGHHLGQGGGVAVQLLPGAQLGNRHQERIGELGVVGGKVDAGQVAAVGHGAEDLLGLDGQRER